MAKGKKLLSVVLALVMVFSAVSAALIAFAESPEDVVERINAFNGTTGSKATEEEIKEFESIAAKYKALTDKQKDELDITATGKLFKLAFDRGQVVKAEEAGSDFYAKYVLADEYAAELLGRTENAGKAQAYWETFCETTVTVGEKEIAIKDAKAADIKADTQGVIAAAFDKAAADYKYVDTYGLISFKEAASTIKGLVGAPRVEAFIAAVSDAAEPYTREAVQKAIDAYNEVFSESYSQIPAEILDKFEDMIANMPASEEKPVLPGWARPDLKYPAEVAEKRTALLVETLDAMINDLIKQQGYDGISDILAKELYTNYTVAMIPQALYPMLEQLLNDNGASIAVGFLKLTPQKLAAAMDEEKFEKARDLFNSLAPEGEKDATSHWANLDLAKVENGTFGFQDGDREGFVNALAAVLRGLTVPLTDGLLAVDFANEVNVPNVTYGIYENLLPVLEALDVEGLMTSKEYTDQFNAAEGNAKGDAAILPVLNPIFDFVENKLSSAPLSTLVDLLPKLAHVLNDNILNDQLQLIIADNLGMIGSFAGDMLAGLKIEPSMIIGLVNSLVGNLQIGDVTLSLKLSDPDWVLLASTAKPVIKDSVTADNAYRVGFETNKSDAFLVIFSYLFENITEKDNLASIKNAISALVNDPAITQVVDQVLGSIATLSADEALVMVCDLLGVPQTEEPTEPTDPVTPTGPDADGSDDSDGAQVPPANGDTIMVGALAAAVVLAGAALVITGKRK